MTAVVAYHPFRLPGGWPVELPFPCYPRQDYSLTIVHELERQWADSPFSDGGENGPPRNPIADRALVSFPSKTLRGGTQRHGGAEVSATQSSPNGGESSHSNQGSHLLLTIRQSYETYGS